MEKAEQMTGITDNFDGNSVSAFDHVLSGLEKLRNSSEITSFFDSNKKVVEYSGKLVA